LIKTFEHSIALFDLHTYEKAQIENRFKWHSSNS